VNTVVNTVLIVKSTNIYFASAHHLLVKSAYSQEKSGGVQIRVNTTCRNYGVFVHPEHQWIDATAYYHYIRKLRQSCRILCITGRNDKPLAAARTRLVRIYCCSEHRTDCSKQWNRRMQNSTVRL